MKISLELIIRELINSSPDFTVTYFEGTDLATMKLSGICSIDTETELRNGTFYLINPSCNILDNPDMIKSLKKSDSVICCLERIEGEVEQSGIPYIGIIKKTEFGQKSNFPEQHVYNRIFHIVYDIFQKYETWQQNLFFAVEHTDIQEMLDCSVPIFQKSIYVTDNESEYLAASGPCLDYGGSGSQVPLEVFNNLKNDAYNNQTLSEQEPFLFPAGILSADALCQDIFVNGEFFCRIIIIDELSHDAFISGDYKLMNILSNALQLTINQSDPLGSIDKENTVNRSSLISIINQMLLNKRIEKNQLNGVLIQNGWVKNEGCYIGYLLLYPSNIKFKSAQYYCRYISKKFAGVYSIERNDHLLLIIRESVYPSLNEFFAQFILFIRDSNFRFGISNLCSDLMQLSLYYREAEIAANYGIQRNETIWCHKFSECSFDYLLQEACHEIPAELLCAPELILLQNYDKEKKTDYYQTLRTYLDSRMNATRTAKKLYIHQATMVYRLKRLKELTGINYEDTDRMLYLHLSYKILEID